MEMFIEKITETKMEAARAKAEADVFLHRFVAGSVEQNLAELRTAPELFANLFDSIFDRVCRLESMTKELEMLAEEHS